MSQQQHIYAAALTLVLAAVSIAPQTAQADTDELGSWNTFGLEHGFRNTDNVGYDDAAGQSKTGTGQQASYAFSARGNLWRPQHRTFLRTLPGMNYDFTILKFNEVKGLDGDVNEYANQDKKGAGWMFGIKVGAPWALIERPRLKFGLGFGFGINYEINTLEPNNAPEWWGFDFDGFLTSTVSLYPTGEPWDLSIEATYEYAPLNIMFGQQQRARVWLLFKKLGVGVRWEQASDPDFMELALAVAYRI